MEKNQDKNKDNKQEIKKFNHFASQIQFLKGIGPKRAEVLAEIGILTVEDLLKYYPKSYIDITAAQSLRELKKIFSGNKKDPEVSKAISQFESDWNARSKERYERALDLAKKAAQ